MKKLTKEESLKKKGGGMITILRGKSSGLVLTEHVSVNCPLCVQREPLQRDSTFAFKD